MDKDADMGVIDQDQVERLQKKKRKHIECGETYDFDLPEIDFSLGCAIDVNVEARGWVSAVICKVKEEKILVHINGSKAQWIEKTSPLLSIAGTMTASNSTAY